MAGVTAMRSFQWACLFAWLGITSIAAIVIGSVITSLPLPSYDSYYGPKITDIGYAMLFASLLTLIASMIGAATTILLGWRSDERQIEEFKLRIEQLEGLSEPRDSATNISRKPN